ncbi:MAG: YeeE/YedE thiosulfate transporter family protein [Polyangiaceae bacterium]
MKIDSFVRLGFGLLTGMAFGALLQRGRVTHYDVIQGQLLRRDYRVAKLMATAAAVSATGLHALVREGRAELAVKPLRIGGVLGGGLIFGTGLALLGYCPGTTLAALGEGRRDAIAGAVGMMTGASLFVRLLPTMKPLLTMGDFGAVTIPGLTKTSPWLWIALLDAGLILLLLADASDPRLRRIPAALKLRLR